MPVRIRLTTRLVAHHFCALNRDVPHLIAGHVEHHFAPSGADGIVQVDDGRPRAGQTGKAGSDQVFTALRQYLDHHVVGDPARLHESGNEIELGRTCAGEPDFDFLHAHVDEQIEKAGFLVRVHGVDDGLITVAQIGRQPPWRSRYGARRPLPVGQRDLRKGRIFGARVAEHGHLENLGSCGNLRVKLRPLGAQRTRAGTQAVTPKGV